MVTLASQIKPRPVRWLWPDRIPAGALTLLAGREDIGKSLVGVHLAAQLTRGTLPGSTGGPPVPRAVRHLRGRVGVHHGPAAARRRSLPRPRRPRPGRRRRPRHRRHLPVDVPALSTYMAAHDVGLLVLDPLTSVMDGRIDAHRDREVRTALEPLGQLAEDTGAAVLGHVHLGKGIRTDPVNLILGSRAFSAVARVALVAARDPDDESATSCRREVQPRPDRRPGSPTG